MILSFPQFHFLFASRVNRAPLATLQFAPILAANKYHVQIVPCIQIRYDIQWACSQFVQWALLLQINLPRDAHLAESMPTCNHASFFYHIQADSADLVVFQYAFRDHRQTTQFLDSSNFTPKNILYGFSFHLSKHEIVPIVWTIWTRFTRFDNVVSYNLLAFPALDILNDTITKLEFLCLLIRH
jgi:hypothetical protein